MELGTWIIPLIILCCSALISWGVTKATIKFNEERISELVIKINEITKKLGNLVCSADCNRMREQCKSDFAEIKLKMDVNKDTVTGQFGELKRFMGRVEEYMRTHNGIKK